MDNKEIILESSKREMGKLVRCKYQFTDIFESKIKWITEDCNKLNIKDKELDDLIEFRRILRNEDIIDPDIKLYIYDYKPLVEALPIYKEKGIKAVNEYLRSVSINKESTNNTKEQKIVITDNQEQTTTDLKEKIVKCFFSGKCGADFYIKSIQKQYALCDEKDQELEKLIDFYWSMENDIINTDLEKDINYKDILSCIPIYKENGIKGVEEYLGKEK